MTYPVKICIQSKLRRGLSSRKRKQSVNKVMKTIEHILPEERQSLPRLQGLALDLMESLHMEQVGKGESFSSVVRGPEKGWLPVEYACSELKLALVGKSIETQGYAEQVHISSGATLGNSQV